MVPLTSDDPFNTLILNQKSVETEFLTFTKYISKTISMVHYKIIINSFVIFYLFVSKLYLLTSDDPLKTLSVS